MPKPVKQEMWYFSGASHIGGAWSCEDRVTENKDQINKT